jgi:hypothetical protein
VQGYLVADVYQKLDKKYPALANNEQPGAKKTSAYSVDSRKYSIIPLSFSESLII